MALPGNTAANAIVVHDSDGEAEHPPKADTSNDAAIALLYFQEINPNRNARGLGRYYDGPPEENRGRLTLCAGGKEAKRKRTQPSRAHPCGAARTQDTVAPSTVTHAVSASKLDTRGRPDSAPPGFSALPASQAQAGPAPPRSASAPPRLPDLGNVAPYLGPTRFVNTSLEAVALLKKKTEPSLFAWVQSPVPGYLARLEGLPVDKLREVALFGIDPDHVNEARLRRIQSIQVNPNPARGIRSG